MKRKLYFIFCLIWITSIILFSGCTNETKVNSSNVSNDKTKNKLTLEQIKQSYAKTDEKILDTQTYKKYVLVESQVPTLANRFTLYNLKTGSKNILPSGVDLIDSANIIDDNNIILYSKGTNSESVNQVFPYEIDCTRSTENNSQDGGFIPIYKEIKFPVDKQISLKGKGKEEITDIRVTLNGLQVCFGPQRGSETGFVADYVDCPSTDISYDNTTGEFSLKFQDTIIAKSLLKANEISQHNTYIKSLNIKQDNNVAMIKISLNDTAKYYTGKKSSIEYKQESIGIPYMDMEFFNNNIF